MMIRVVVLASALVLASISHGRAELAPYRVQSGSMSPTLEASEQLEVTTLDPTSVRSGDVIIYSGENTDRTIAYAKRVLALPGHRIEFRDGVPIIDGVSARREVQGEREAGGHHWTVFLETIGGRTYLVQQVTSAVPRLRDMSERIVSEGHVFVADDSRDNSGRDSRSVGPIPFGRILGRAQSILWSPDASRSGVSLDPATANGGATLEERRH